MDMIIVLPDEIEGLKFLEENFDWNVIVNAERSMGMTQLSLPKFKIEATMDMKAILGEVRDFNYRVRTVNDKLAKFYRLVSK